MPQRPRRSTPATQMARDDDSITTLHVWLLVATTFILTFSLNGEIHAPCRASTMNKSSLYFTLENFVRFISKRCLMAVYVVRAEWEKFRVVVCILDYFFLRESFPVVASLKLLLSNTFCISSNCLPHERRMLVVVEMTFFRTSSVNSFLPSR